MNAIKLLGETKDTVTIGREDWTALLAELEEVEDRAAVRVRRAEEAEAGTQVARRDYLTGQEALRLLQGECPVRVWREKRGMTQRALAASAGVAPSYLAEIEGGRKPGSADALSRLARALGVPMDHLMSGQSQRNPEYGPVHLRYRPHSPGVGPSGRGSAPLERPFACVRDALAHVGSKWPSLRNQSPEIVDEQRLPVFSQEDLYREWEPHLFEQHAPRTVTFEEEASWDKGSWIMWALVEGEPVRCRMMEEVFRDCLDEAASSRKDIARLFARHRAVFERAARNAIQQGRFNAYQNAGRSRREVVIDVHNFHLLLTLGDR